MNTKVPRDQQQMADLDLRAALDALDGGPVDPGAVRQFLLCEVGVEAGVTDA